MGIMLSRFGEHVFNLGSSEKEKITTFNKLEYTPVVGSAIGAVKIAYGVLKMALEIIKGIGNYFLKNNEYKFVAEFDKGLCSFGRGLGLLIPGLGGWVIYQMDKDNIYRYNYKNAEALLSVENITEKDIDQAYEFAKKLPARTNNQLKDDLHDPTMDVSQSRHWALTRRYLIIDIHNKYILLNLHEKANNILEAKEEKLRSRIHEQEKLKQQEVSLQRQLVMEKGLESQKEKEKTEKVARANVLRLTGG